MASTLDTVLSEIAEIQRSAREEGKTSRPQWPMIVLRSPKGLDGSGGGRRRKQVEGTWRSHQVPLSETHSNREHAKLLEQWLKSYRPAELFDADGTPKQDLLDGPGRERRMSAQPYANGGRLLRQLVTPNWMEYCVDVQAPATTFHEPTRVLGGFLRDVMAANSETANFRVFGPDGRIPIGCLRSSR